MNNKLHRKK